ncbi:MAG TPA: cache domain-containing protein [Terriglobales bacterium]|nr:cache domain-containing protein [Terriglobales bacterium]
MPFDSSEFHIPLQRLFVALILILIPISIFGLYIGLQASQQVQEMNGAYFRTIARGSAAITSQYIGEQVSELVQIANEPTVQSAVTEANRSYENMPEAAIRARADQVEGKWNTAESDLLVRKILGSDVARSIRRHHELNPKFLSITVVDQAGAAVAATEKPLRYFQTESEYWRAISAKGQPKTYVSDVHFDGHSQYVTVSSPIYQEGSGRFVGVITALVDVSPLFSYLNQLQIARTGRVFLIRDDGTVVTAPGVSPTERVNSEEFAAIRDALGSLHRRESSYLTATLRNRETYLIGFADTSLKASYPNLPWMIVVSQDLREAEGPVRNMVIFSMIMTLVSVLLLSIFGAYVFLHRKQRIQDLEEEKPEPAPEEPATRHAAAS